MAASSGGLNILTTRGNAAGPPFSDPVMLSIRTISGSLSVISPTFANLATARLTGRDAVSDLMVIRVSACALLSSRPLTGLPGVRSLGGSGQCSSRHFVRAFKSIPASRSFSNARSVRTLPDKRQCSNSQRVSPLPGVVL